MFPDTEITDNKSLITENLLTFPCFLFPLLQLFKTENKANNLAIITTCGETFFTQNFYSIVPMPQTGNRLLSALNGPDLFPLHYADDRDKQSNQFEHLYLQIL